MSAAATAAVMRELADLPPGPALLYDVGVIASRMRRAREAARAAGVELLFAVKSFPLPAAIELAATHLDGLDVAGSEEQRLILGTDFEAPRTTVSITWPGDVDRDRLAALAARHRVTVVCETAAQLAAAAAVRDVTLAIRLRSDDDSRFGVAADQLRAVAAAAPDRVRALHVHGGPLLTAPARVAERARAACAAADIAGIKLEQLDLGGSLHGFALDRPTAGQSTIAAALAAARAEVPTSVRLIFEPGRFWTEGAGFATGRVLATRDLAPTPHLDGGGGLLPEARVTAIAAGSSAYRTARLACTLELSRLAHLRWCTPRLVAPPPRANAPRLGVELWGASCCEDDRIDDAWIPAEHAAALDVGQRVVLAGISGYAAAWNRSFAGVPAAHVIVVGA